MPDFLVSGSSNRERFNIIGFYLSPPEEQFHGKNEFHATMPFLPTQFAPKQNHPNPFNPSASIAFDVPKASPVQLEIYDISGRRIRTLIHTLMPAGSNQVVWDGSDETGRLVASGVCIYRLRAGDFVASREMLLVR